MAEYPLQLATRQIRRIFERAIRRSIPKILTELITNSDDSYRRLPTVEKAADPDEPRKITIRFQRSKKRFSVTDRAEGLTDAEMKDRFVTYGREAGDRSKGFKTRSLFGKGLRDVLFTQHYGQVKSIKGGKFYNCRFRWKEADGQKTPVVEIKPPSRVTEELREALGIPGNGTVVEFQLGNGVSNPQPDKLIEKLSRFYMLRMINSSAHREVVLETLDRQGGMQAETQLNYGFPDIEVLDRVDKELRTEDGAVILIKGEIGLTPIECTQGEVGYEDREGGILLVDEDDAVLDLTLFGFDEDPNARRISGLVRLVGAGDYIRRKLNDATPEEILLETRDGFDKNHPFYLLLKNNLRPHISPIVESLREKRTPPKSTLSEPTREKHKKAFDVLNQLYKDMLGKTGRVPAIPGSLRKPPETGIAFLTSHVSIQTGVSTPVALLLNRTLVQAGDELQLEVDRSEISVSPTRLVIDEVDDVTRAQVKIIRLRSEVPEITGKLTVSWKTVRVEISVTTTTREIITPVNGIEFERDEYSVRLGGWRHLQLFIDVSRIPIGSGLAIAVESPALKLTAGGIALSGTHLVTPGVAQVDVPVRGTQLAKNVIVTASTGAYVAGTVVSVVKREKKDRGAAGIFQGYNFVPLERKIQSQFDPLGWILINTKDPVNQRYFGADPFRALEENAHCQVRLADLVLNECLQMMVSEALQDDKLDRRFPDNPEIDLRNYVDEKKFEIGPQIHALIVTKI
jgi:hypothetical protein